MSQEENLVASAKKAARRMARATDLPYQSCLDEVARQAGRPHWGAFLEKPLPLDGSQANRSGDPDAETTLALILRKALITGKDAVSIRSGRISSWIVGGTSHDENVPIDLVEGVRMALIRMARADIDGAGPHPFVFEGQQCALALLDDGTVNLSIRGMDLARRFGSLNFSDRVLEDGTVVDGPTETSVLRPPPVPRVIRGRRRVDPYQSGIRAVMSRLGIGRDDDPLRDAARRRQLTIGGSDSDGGLLGLSRDGRIVRLQEHIPILLASPLGAGKIAATIMPYILSAVNDSMVVHEDGNIWEMTSGYRSHVGQVHVLRLDAPHSYGSLNPLHRDWLPEDAGAYRSYLHALSQAFSPEDAAVASRILGSIDDELFENAEATLKGVAIRLHDAMTADRTDQTARAAYEAVEPMMDRNVVACTTRAGLTPSDLRGVHAGTDGRGWNVWKPTTVYIVRSPTGGARMGRVAAVLQTAIWSHAIASAPNEILPGGRRTGPLRIMTIMDGIARLPVMPMLAMAIERGRSTKVGHMVVGNTPRSVAKLFDGRHRDDYESLFGMMIVYPQTDVSSASSLAARFHGLTPADIMAMPDRSYMMIMQNVPEPVWMRMRFFFEDRDLLQRTFNPRTLKGPRPLGT